MIYSHLILFFLFSAVSNSINEHRGGKRNHKKRNRMEQKMFFKSQYARHNPRLQALSRDPNSYSSYAHSQCYEDIWIYEHWFYGKSNGIILESGALDGISYSTSYLFARFAQWSAIHIEADPVTFTELTNNRKQSININAALCSEPKILHWINIGGAPIRGAIELMSPAFLKQWHPLLYENPSLIEKLPPIHCHPMKKILEDLEIRHIDLWVLDIEGGEEDALLGTDFESVKIDTIAMECDSSDHAKNQRKLAILQMNHYICEKFKNNCMCRHEDFTVSKALKFTVEDHPGCWKKLGNRNRNETLV